MKYCVILGTITVIDGSDNSNELMVENASSAGYTENQIEILTAEQYKQRVDSVPGPALPPTDSERITALEDAITALLGL
jgi:hypothetical protein